MRIKYLITIGAVLLSISIAESDWPIGLSGEYHYQHHRQKLLRPIVVERFVESKPEESALTWLMNMVSRAIAPIQKQQPAMIGPIKLPGLVGRVYIRRSENYSPRELNHVVIKMVTHSPVTEINIPFDSSLTYQRLNDSSRKYSKPHGYQMNGSPWSSSVTTPQGYESFSTAKKFTTWNSNHRPTNHHYTDHYSKPYSVHTLNDFYPDEYSKTVQEHHNDNQQMYQKYLPMPITPLRHSVKVISSPPVSIYPLTSHRVQNDTELSNFNYHHHEDSTLRVQSNHSHSNIPAFSSPTLTQHSDYRPKENMEDHRTEIKITDVKRHELSNRLPSVFLTHKQVVRTDRMVPNHFNRHQFRKRDETDLLTSSNWKGPRGFRQGPMIKFEIDDVRDSKTIAVPEVKHMQSHEITLVEDENVITKPWNFTMNDREDSISISIRNGELPALTESAEHIIEKKTDSPAAKTLQTTLTKYKTIDRTHRGQHNQNVSVESTSESCKYADCTDQMDNFDGSRRKQKADQDGVKSHNSVVDGTHVVTNMTTTNRWQIQEGSRPTRIVKAIYKRKPSNSFIKFNRGITGSISSNKDTKLYGSSLET